MLVSSRGMNSCPYCGAHERQVRAGFNRTGSQRLQCQTCRRQHTPEAHPLGYADEVRERALKLYLEGNGLRRIGRLLKINHQTVANWVTAAHRRLPTPAKGETAAQPAATAATAATLEMDELYTFVGSKKAKPSSSRSSIAGRG